MSGTSTGEMLSRTTLLLNQELFGGEADEAAVVDGLTATSVHLDADELSLCCRAGQSAVVTAFNLIVRLGISVELDVPDVELIDQVPPLRHPSLRAALLDLGADLMPGVLPETSGAGTDLSFSFSSRSPSAGMAVSVTDFTMGIEEGVRGGCTGELPFGGFAAGAAVAAMALEAALPHIEAATGRKARQPRPSAGPPAAIDLLQLFPRLRRAAPHQLGKVDAISGGAITNALLFCLLRIPGIEADLRVIEADVAEISNLNRYCLLRASHVGKAKTALLASAATQTLRIETAESFFTPDTRASLVPLAPTVLVGADDIEARWWVQEAKPWWLLIGATSNHMAQITTHVSAGACAGCLHPVPLPPQRIPTISFVSFWAGFMQSCALLAEPASSRSTSVFPFALGESMPYVSAQSRANRSCPVHCDASRALARLAA